VSSVESREPEKTPIVDLGKCPIVVTDAETAKEAARWVEQEARRALAPRIAPPGTLPIPDLWPENLLEITRPKD
jgi:hypothetical protein